VNDDEHSLLLRWELVIVTYNVWNKTPESIFRLHETYLPEGPPI